MEPVSAAFLAALAGGAGADAGRQAWAGLRALVRRPLRRGDDSAGPDPDETALDRLRRDPHDAALAQALSAALALRAAADADFLAALRQWHEQARADVADGDGVRNEITGGTFSGPVLQGRDFSDITFHAPRDPRSAIRMRKGLSRTTAHKSPSHRRDDRI